MYITRRIGTTIDMHINILSLRLKTKSVSQLCCVSSHALEIRILISCWYFGIVQLLSRCNRVNQEIVLSNTSI